MQIKIPRKGYAERLLYKKGNIEINPGITVLIGCNGSGKTTLLHLIKEYAKKENIPTYDYNNLSINNDSFGMSLYNEDYAFLSQLWTASEGESITLNLMHKSEEIIYLLNNGEKKKSKVEAAFSSLLDIKEQTITSNKRILLLDAIDSGLSIDQVQDLKEYFLKPIIEKYTENELYIIISSNEYELCKGYNCFNVTDSKYVNIDNYDTYSKEILRTRQYKETQLNK